MERKYQNFIDGADNFDQEEAHFFFSFCFNSLFLLFFFFFFFLKQTHTREREMDSNTKAHHNSIFTVGVYSFPCTHA